VATDVQNDIDRVATFASLQQQRLLSALLDNSTKSGASHVSRR